MLFASLLLAGLAALSAAGAGVWLWQERTRLRAARTQYRLLFERNPLPFWVFHRDSLRFLEVNAAALEQYGYSRQEFLAMTLADIRPPEEVAEAIGSARSPSEEERKGRVWRHLRRDGSPLQALVHAVDIDFRGQKARLVMALDVTEQLQARERLERSEQRFQLVARATSDAVFDWNIVTGESWRTDTFDHIFGYRSEEMPPTIEGWRERLHPEDLPRVDARLEKFFASDGLEWEEHYRFRRGDGSYAQVVDRGRVQRAADGRPLRMVGGMLDVSHQHETEEALKQQQAQAAYQSSHDDLTGLLNRGALLAELDRRLAQPGAEAISLLHLEIDDFHLINDSLGHAVGDAVLRAVAERLRAAAGAGDCVGRVSGSEFLVLLVPAPGQESARAAGARLLAALAAPLQALGTLHYLRVNAGFAAAGPGDNAQGMLRRAGLATREARRRGDRQLVEYTPQFEVEVRARQQLVSRLHEAIEREEFQLHYQLLFDAATQRPLGMEALVRWLDPARGMVPPGEFIPVCEQSGLIVPLGRWVLREAARQRARLVQAGWPGLGIAVNVSALQFRSGELLQDIPALMREFDLPGGFLELELTESLVMENPEGVIATMRELREQGVQIAIDDFGTGYSSMGYLHRLPVDKLKIDRSFVAGVEDNAHNAAICESILALARSFGLKVIAEGVETEAQLAWLRARHCDEAQGYLLARPLPFAEVLAKLGTP